MSLSRKQILILCFYSSAALSQNSAPIGESKRPPIQGTKAKTSGSTDAPTTKDSKKLNDSDPQQKTSDKNQEDCLKLFNRYAVPYKDLWAKRPKDLKIEDTDGLNLIEDMTAQHCQETETRKEFITLLTKLLNQHSGKIAVILPLTTKIQTRHIIKGSKNLDPKNVLIIYDSVSQLPRLESFLSEAIFKHRASAIVAGYESSELLTLNEVSAKFSIPVFAINNPQPNSVKNNFMYYTHPTPNGIAQAIVKANKFYNHKKISILRPNDQHSDNIARELEIVAKSEGVEVLHNVSFDNRRADQMERAARQLFKLAPNERLDELKRLFENAKRHAAAKGQTFNPRMVALQPVVLQDAIVILDHFKSVRHMAKIFTYLGVRKLPLVGHFEWRSAGLVEPFDPVFSGSYFVDIIGNYSAVPEGLRVPALSNQPLLISHDKVEQLDFSMIGYRAVQTPVNLSMAKSKPRRKLDSLIPRTSGISAEEIYFNDANTINWPTYQFEVVPRGSGGSIILK
ncbi:MAG: hypothetical protein NT027_13460 [Proteobacteria bacterium]|nr:hypothetical protein [Pseudomonadota bacterium]